MIGPCDTNMRVWPTDLDVFMHVNNGVYLTLMDLGRTDMMLRSGMFGPIRQQGWYPVVAAQTIRFRRSLRLFERFVITTRVVGWDDKSIFLEQIFTRGDERIAHAAVEARFLSQRGGGVTPAELLAVIGHHEVSPAIPPWILAWKQSVVDMV